MIRAVLTLAFAQTPAADDSARLEVDAAGCPRVSGPAVARLLELEIRPVLQAAEGNRFRVKLRCDRASTEISVEDPLTNKGIRRETGPVADGDPDPDRTVALSAAQLFYVSWHELESPPPVTDPAPYEPPPSGASRAARYALQRQQLVLRPNDIVVAGGLRWRHLRKPVLLGHMELRYGRWLVPSWGVQLRAGVEIGEAGRTLGEVRVVDALAGAAAAFRAPAAGVAAFQIELGADVIFQHLSGRATAPDVRVDTALGITGQVGGTLGLALRGSRVLGLVGFEAGYVFRGPVARIEDETPVRADGVVLGATLRLGLPV